MLIRNSIHGEWFDRKGLILVLEGMCDLDLFEMEQIIRQHLLSLDYIKKHRYRAFSANKESMQRVIIR